MTAREETGTRSEIYQTGAALPWLVLALVMLVDWFVPLALALAYPGYNSLTMSMTAFGMRHSPTYWFYKTCLVGYALIVFYTSLDGYGYLVEGDRRLARIVVGGLLVYALLPGFITGITPYDVIGAESVVLSAAWVLIIIGYAALYCAGLALTALVWRTGRSREGALMLGLLVLVPVLGLVALVAPMGMPGLWERLLNNVCLMPFILFGLTRWTLDRDSLMEAAPVNTPRRLAAAEEDDEDDETAGFAAF